MSSIISCFKWQKTYGYFTEEKQLFETITLNWFQRVLRWCHIKYTNTHLEKVGKIAHEQCLTPDLFWTHSERKLLAEILKKKEWSRVDLGTGEETCDSDGKKCKVFYTGKYIGKSDLLDFEVTIKEDNKESRKARIQLQKGADKITTVKAIHEITENKEDAFTTAPYDLLAKVTYTFLVKILANSISSPELKMSDKLMDPIGGALRAHGYGFKGKNVDLHKPWNMVQSPQGMILSRNDAIEIGSRNEIPKRVALDVLYFDSAR